MEKEMITKEIKKEGNLFDIRQSDVRRAKALHYKNPYTFLNDVGKLLNVDEIDRTHHLLFTRNNCNRFELQLRSGSVGDGDLVTYTVLDGRAIPIYQDKNVRGGLIWLDKSDTKRNEDGTITIFKKVGLCLVQKEKYFGYNLTSEIFNMDKPAEKLIQHHIYGYGKILK